MLKQGREFSENGFSLREGFKKKKKKLMEFSIKGPDPPTHPP